MLTHCTLVVETTVSYIPFVASAFAFLESQKERFFMLQVESDLEELSSYWTVGSCYTALQVYVPFKFPLLPSALHIRLPLNITHMSDTPISISPAMNSPGIAPCLLKE